MAKLLKYSSPYSILVVRWDNRLIQVYCPFKAIVIKDIEELKEGDAVWVWKVLISTGGRTVYVISGKPYYYYHFDIMMEPYK